MAKPSGRLKKSYRIMWNDDSGGGAGVINPPITPERLAQVSFGQLEGSPVDAYVMTVGPAAGYTLSYPTKVEGMEFIVDRSNSGALIGESAMWRVAENLKALWSKGFDPFEIQIGEAKRLGIDYWLQIRMNDWHHVDTRTGKVYRLIGSRFYEEHPEYLIGKEGVKGWPETLQTTFALFQDFVHPEVRQLRLSVAEEACERYDVAGFEYDFMRCPGYFKYGEEEANTHLMTQLIRDTRSILDRIGTKKGKVLGLSVRVPNTIEGALRLGLDVRNWIEEDLVDIVVPSTFFAADTEEDISEWADLTADSPVRINPAIEEGYSAGYCNGFPGIPYFQIKGPVMRPLSVSMINAIASRHWRNGADGLYVFNWRNTVSTYNYDDREAIDNIGNPLRLKYKTKRYAVMRRNNSFPNCLPVNRQSPAVVGSVPVKVKIDVTDDLSGDASRVRRTRLYIVFFELTVADRVEVKLNGKELNCINPLIPGKRCPVFKTIWQIYDLEDSLPLCGINEITLRLMEQDAHFREQVPLEVTDIELEIDYDYPNGPWIGIPGYISHSV